MKIFRLDKNASKPISSTQWTYGHDVSASDWARQYLRQGTLIRVWADSRPSRLAYVSCSGTITYQFQYLDKDKGWDGFEPQSSRKYLKRIKVVELPHDWEISGEGIDDDR